jgi:hypothetical protein
MAEKAEIDIGAGGNAELGFLLHDRELEGKR